MSSNDEVYRKVLSGVQSGHEEPTAITETDQGDESMSGLPQAKHDAEKSKVASVTLDNLFRNPEAHPIVLDLVLLRKYGASWLDLEIETLVAKIQEDFKTPTVADVNIEKLQACKALHLVDDFWLRWEVFLPCVAALNGGLADFDNMQAPTVAECLLAVDIANRIRDDVPWSTEIKTYLGVVHQYSSELCPQSPMEFVTVDTEGLAVDCADVHRRWPEVRAGGKSPMGASAEDVQLRKMLGSWVYLEAMRMRLQSQLKVLSYV